MTPTQSETTSTPTSSVTAVTDIKPTSSTDAPAPAGAAEALAARTAHARSDLEELLSIVPPDRQAKAGQLIVALLAKAREELHQPSPSKLALGTGRKYRLQDRAPRSENPSASSAL